MVENVFNLRLETRDREITLNYNSQDTGRWVPCGEADPDATELTVEGLTPGKKYKFRVKAVNKEGESDPLESSEPVEAKNPYREPDPPRNIQIYDWDNMSVTLR